MRIPSALPPSDPTGNVAWPPAPDGGQSPGPEPRAADDPAPARPSPSALATAPARGAPSVAQGAEPLRPGSPPPPAQGWLASPAADGVSLLLFALAAAFVGDVLLLWSPSPLRALAAASVSVLGALGVAIERGRARRLSLPAAAGVGAASAGLHLFAATAPAAAGAWWAAPVSPAWLAARCLLVLVAGAFLARWGARLDRGEEAWRALVRAGPPSGESPLANHIAALRFPPALTPLSWALGLCGLPLRLAALAAILGYQLTVSRLMPSACRYEPSCSRYGFGAVWAHGFLRGGLLTALRLLRCSPIGPGGYDPVPRPEGSPRPR